jgi:hypothetical protein
VFAVTGLLCVSKVAALGQEAAVEFRIGNALGEVGAVLDIPNQEPQGPEAIAASPSGELFVLDTVNKRIVRVPSENRGPEVFEISEAVHGKDLVVTDRYYYVLDTADRQVLKYDREGGLISRVAINPDVSLGGSVRLAVLAEEDIRLQLPGGKSCQ